MMDVPYTINVYQLEIFKKHTIETLSEVYQKCSRIQHFFLGFSYVYYA